MLRKRVAKTGAQAHATIEPSPAHIAWVPMLEGKTKATFALGHDCLGHWLESREDAMGKLHGFPDLPGRPMFIH